MLKDPIFKLFLYFMKSFIYTLLFYETKFQHNNQPFSIIYSAHLKKSTLFKNRLQQKDTALSWSTLNHYLPVKCTFIIVICNFFSQL